MNKVRTFVNEPQRLAPVTYLADIVPVKMQAMINTQCDEP
jgi:hypothetical protein